MLGNLLRLGELKVRDVMAPRAEIVAVDESISLAELLKLFREVQHSRLPMFRETLDDPTGLIHVKGEAWNLQMAAMGVGLSDSDLAAVLTYVRGSWGNTVSPVTDDDVKAMRALVAGHPPINGEAGLKAIKE